MIKVKKNQDQVKDKRTGKFALSESSPAVRHGRPGILGFSQWFKDTRPRVLTSRNTYEQIRLTRTQIETLKEVLAVDDQGKLTHSISVLCWPRRHGKTTLFCLILLWLLTTRKNQVLQLVGNSEAHSRKTLRHSTKESMR